MTVAQRLMSSRRRISMALALVIGLSMLAPGGAVRATETAAPAWDGSIDLYRDGVFTTQKTWYAPKAMIWDGRFVSIQPIAARPVVGLVISAVPARSYHLPL